MRDQRRRVGVMACLALAALLVAPGLVSPAHGQTEDPPACTQGQLVAAVLILEAAGGLPFIAPAGGQLFDNGIVCVFAIPPGEGGGSQLQCPSEDFTFVPLPENQGVCLRVLDAVSNVGPLPPADSSSQGDTATFSGVILLAALALLAGGLHWEARRQRLAAPSDRT